MIIHYQLFGKAASTIGIDIKDPKNIPKVIVRAITKPLYFGF